MRLQPERKPTQVKRPWRAMVRTTIAAMIGLLPSLPLIADAADIEHIPVVVNTLAITAAITRIMAIPTVERWLQDYAPWLSAYGAYQPRHRKEEEDE